jgi:single-strand DNA-binding protein
MADASINLVGNITRDPELKFLDSGTPAARFGVAVTRKWKDNRGEQKEQTSFFDCSALGSIAENIGNSLRKGDRVVVVGTLEQRSYDDKDGNKRNVTEVKVEAIGPDLRWATVATTKPGDTPYKAAKPEPEDFF